MLRIRVLTYGHLPCMVRSATRQVRKKLTAPAVHINISILIKVRVSAKELTSNTERAVSPGKEGV